MDPPAGVPVTPALITLGSQLLANKRYLIGVVALIVWDYFLTLAEEVELLWKAPWSPVKCLFIGIRYGSLATFAAFAYAWFSPNFSPQDCQHFKLEGFSTLVLTAAAQLVLILRIFAMYSRNYWVISGLCALSLAQIGFGIRLFTGPGTGPLQLPPINVDAFRACVLVPSPDLGFGFSSVYLWMDLAFDLTVCILTIVKALRSVKFHSHSTLVSTLLLDGLLYFVTIFAGNLVWVIMLLVAPPGLKFMNTYGSLVMTVIMINRLTLSLKGAGRGPNLASHHVYTSEIPLTPFH